MRTGKHTGRSPKDKFIVDEPTSHDKIWWGEVNRPISEAHYDRLRARLVAYVSERDLYAQDCSSVPIPAHQRRLRVYTETAWASIFARNLFRGPSPAELVGFEPNFTIICVPSFKADPETEGTRTETAILVHLAADGDPHRRHRVRGRDQEARVHGHERPDARRGRPADAQLGQCRAWRRQRPCSSACRERARRRSPPTRSAASSATTSTAGATALLQLRGRLLREDDPPLPDVRAGHLPDDPSVRDGPRERRPRSDDPRARPRLGAVHREHPGRLPAASSSATPTRPGSRSSRGPSCCSRPTRSGSCRRSAG